MIAQIKRFFRGSMVHKALLMLPNSSKKKVYFAGVIQVGLAFLDLIGVALIGLLGALSVAGVQSQDPSSRMKGILRTLRLDAFSFQNQVAVLAALACFVLVLRTFFSMLATKRILFSLSSQSSEITKTLFSKLLSVPPMKWQSKSSQELVYSLTVGVSAVTVGILGTTIMLLADAALLIIMFGTILIVDFVMFAVSIVFFGCLGFALHHTMGSKAKNLAEKNSELSISSNSKILEALKSYREVYIRNRRQYFVNDLEILRRSQSNVLAEIQYQPNVSKYVIESGVVIGAIVVAGAQFALQDAQQAVASLAIFLAAGTRIAPAVLRFQQNLIQLESNSGAAQSTFELIEFLSEVSTLEPVQDLVDFEHLGFISEVELLNVDFRYPNNTEQTISCLSLNIGVQDFIALVGSSGAGKTTLIDVLLGILKPDAGQILISGVEPSEAILNWPGAIAYVPQDVVLHRGTIRSNISLGFQPNMTDDQMYWRALEVAQLKEFVALLPLGLDSEVSEDGANLSGGQRQRLGIARALYTQPKLLILDEATSSLDGQTESDISSAIERLRGNVTVVMIAHRLSTVRYADKVVYMESGRILAEGTFAEVRAQVPDFDAQASLMGL
jgi:ATP-binding cassette subfamily C protein